MSIETIILAGLLICLAAIALVLFKLINTLDTMSPDEPEEEPIPVVPTCPFCGLGNFRDVDIHEDKLYNYQCCDCNAYITSLAPLPTVPKKDVEECEALWEQGEN